MKNILDGKYIIIENKNIIKNLNVLYELGYSWKYNITPDEKISVMLYETYDEIYILTFDNMSLGGYDNLKMIKTNFPNYIEIKISHMLREQKLKRILK